MLHLLLKKTRHALTTLRGHILCVCVRQQFVHTVVRDGLCFPDVFVADHVQPCLCIDGIHRWIVQNVAMLTFIHSASAISSILDAHAATRSLTMTDIHTLPIPLSATLIVCSAVTNIPGMAPLFNDSRARGHC